VQPFKKTSEDLSVFLTSPHTQNDDPTSLPVHHSLGNISSWNRCSSTGGLLYGRTSKIILFESGSRGCKVFVFLFLLLLTGLWLNESDCRFEEYREAILNHLLEVCVCHWDGGVRELASQSICQIARGAFNQIPSALLDRLVSTPLVQFSSTFNVIKLYPTYLVTIQELGLQSKDINQVHGSILTLGELAKVVQSDKTENATIQLLEKVS
jgi:hypothetical protein